MARSYGRVFASIWSDEDFRAVPVDARLMYVFLISQPDLDHAGVIPLRVRRWSRALGVTAAEVEKMLAALNDGLFTVTDEDTEELLVRSLVRRDEIWKQPNVFKSAASSATAVASAVIKRALLAEIQRLDVGSASREIQRTRDDLVTLLEPFGNPSPTPPHGHSRADDASPEGHDRDNTESDKADNLSEADVSDNGAGQNPNATLPQGFPMGTSEPTGEGDGNCPVLQEALPLKPSPSPRGGGHVASPLMAVVPNPEPEGEGGTSKQGTLDPIAALVAEIRELRPDWASESIRKALGRRAVSERPWPIVATALRIIAADRTTQGPGRLEHDGPWWADAAHRIGAIGSAAQPAAHEWDPDPEDHLCRYPGCHARAAEPDRVHRRRAAG